MKSMRISSRTRPKIVEKKKAAYRTANRIPWKRTLRSILRDKAITKICDVKTDVDVNCEEEVAENKVLCKIRVSSLEENKVNLVLLCIFID